MRHIRSSFDRAVQQLLKMEQDICVNTLPQGLAFIKGYDTNANSVDNVPKFLSDSIDSRKKASADEVISDILAFLNKGVNIAWVDIMLFYVTDEYAYILVRLFTGPFAESSDIKYHISIIRSSIESTDERFNVNEYVDRLMNKLR